MTADRGKSLVGLLLDGRYRIISRIARGGMSTVYTALDTRLDRIVAVKVPHAAPVSAAAKGGAAGDAPDEAFLSRFLQEAKAAARLSSPHVVSVYDQGSAPDPQVVYLVMEYVEGHTLRDELNLHGALPVADALRVFEALAEALFAAHTSGLIHRDVKPENVLLASDGRIKVADFGLARAVQEAGSAGSGDTGATDGMLLGTASYLAPEQVRGESASPRSDVYSAGIVLYEMLTGAPPYTGDSAAETARRHVDEDVPRPSATVSALPAEIDELVARTTARIRDARPADGSELLALLRRLGLDTAPRPSAAGATALRERDDAATAMLTAVGAPVGSRHRTPDATGRPPESGGTMRGPEHTVAIPVQPAAPTSSTPASTPAAVRSALASLKGVESDADVRTAPDPAGVRPRGPLTLAAVLLVCFGLAVAVWAIFYGPLASTTTPALLGLTQAEAATQAETAGLTVQVGDPEYSETVPVGQVLETNPEPGARIDKGGTIELILSRGKERYEVPDLAGMTLRDARSALDRQNLTLGEQELDYSDSVTEGSVISSKPKSGTKLRRDASVSLVVSQGPPPIAVPSVVAMPRESAEQTLVAATLRFTVTTRKNPTLPAGLVISQKPEPGTRVGPGTNVELVVSDGPDLVQVPDVRQRSIDEATRTLQDAGFKVRRQGPQVFRRVGAQSPNGGSQHPRGGEVTIYTY